MRHARENPELYENPNYSYADRLLRQADDLREQRKLTKPCPNCGKTEWIEDTDLGQIRRCCIPTEGQK